MSSNQMQASNLKQPMPAYAFIYRRLRVLLVLSASVCAQVQPTPVQPAGTSVLYEHRKEHSPDGIGKFYMGREIAQVMGHQAADWLERPERADEEKTELVVD